MPTQLRRLRPSRYDKRDLTYKNQGLEVKDSIDLRTWDSIIEDQGKIGSCVGTAVVGAYELMIRKKYPDIFKDLSKLYTYYHARLLEDSESVDEGVTRIRNGLKGLQKFGVCSEDLWPYDSSLIAVQPNLESYIDAWPRKILNYTSINSLNDALEVLHMEFPIVFGLTIFGSFKSLTNTNAIVSEPKDTTQIFNHAMCLVGYSLESKWMIAKNSYGTKWGDNGYCYIPFDYFNQYAFEQWYFNFE